MATAKKSTKKTATKKASKKASNKVEARPIGQGKDPLAEGARLYNESNTEAETHYKADDSELKAEQTAAKNRIAGQDANERAEEHNAESQPLPSDVPNETETALEEDAADREGR